MALFPTQHDGQLACIKKYVILIILCLNLLINIFF
jgi:hypothetical protein